MSPQSSPRPRSSRRVRAAARVLAALALPALLAAAAVTTARAAHAGEDRTVPAVVGQPLATASDAVRRAGFGVRVIEVAGPDAGTIAEQDPAPNTRLSAGATVTLRVGVAARVKTTMPNVVGLAPEDALAALGRAYDVRISRLDVPVGRAGKVLATRPTAGEETLFRAPVIVVIGVARPQGPLPGDPGTLEADQNLLRPAVPVPPAVPAPPTSAPGAGTPPAHLPPPAVTSGPGPAPAGPATGPLPGSPAVAAPPAVQPLPASNVPAGAKVRMPDVLGSPEAEALRALALVGLRAELLRVDDPGEVAGTVLMQVPSAGSETTSGGTAWLKIAGGSVTHVPPTRPETLPTPEDMPPTTDGDFADPTGPSPPGLGPTPPPVVPPGMFPTPDLIGMTSVQAAEAIVATQLVPHPWYVLREGLPDWQVIAQKDAAGTPLPAGGVVHFRVVLPANRDGSVPMPSLFGLTKEQATNVLRGLGMPLRARLVDPDGKVTLQRPLAGSQIPWGSPIGIVVGPIDDPRALQSTPEVELISEEAAALPPAAPPAAAPPKKKKKNIFDRIGDFIDDTADDVRKAVR